jgi:hypothetical protein
MVWASFNGGSKTIEYPSLDANQEASFASSWQNCDQDLQVAPAATAEREFRSPFGHLKRVLV